MNCGKRTYTVNTLGNNVELAKLHGLNAYYANGVTAIEVPAMNAREARAIVDRKLDLQPVYVFE